MVEKIFLAVTSLLIAPALTILLMSCFRKRVTFEGRHIFVTGGSQGIGLALAMQMYCKGANVTIAARTRKTLDEAVEQIQSSRETGRLNGRVQALQVDVTDFQQVNDANVSTTLSAEKLSIK